MKFSYPIEVLHGHFDLLRDHPQATHAEHRLSLLLRGHLCMQHGELIEITPGCLTLVPAGVVHRLVHGQSLDIWWMGFNLACLAMDESHPLLLPFKQVRAGALPIFQLPAERQPYFIQLLTELERIQQQSNPEADLLQHSLLMLILNEVKGAAQLVQPRLAAQSLVGEALDFINQHCLQPISLKDVAEAVHRSPTHVASTVKKATGYSVGEWICQSRISAACARLKHSSDSIEAIADQVGWTDTTYFIRQFKKIQGVTPAVWRRQQH